MSNLAAFRTRIINSLDDSTSKYSTDVLDEALRKILNEYSRAYPNIAEYTLTVTTAGRSQTLAAAGLMSIVQLVHPYNDALADPFIYEREDFHLAQVAGSPTLCFFGSDIPQVGEKIFVKYAAPQTIEDLDAASATTVRADHEHILIVGASGQAAMMRASGLNEQWGGRPGEMSSLMMWGNSQYRRFSEFLAEIKQEPSIDIFPDSFWNIDKWDK